MIRKKTIYLIGILDFFWPNLCSMMNPLMDMKMNWDKVIMFPQPGWALRKKLDWKRNS